MKNLGVDPVLLKEIKEDRPNSPIGLISRENRYVLLERAILMLYKWYVERSQEKRNWNPDTGFDWRKVGQNHSDRLGRILLGFYAVEQYVPDFIIALLAMIRRSHGRSQFHIRWGAEEQKHMELWRNAVLFSRFRTLKQMDEYTQTLRSKLWTLPFDNPIKMIVYTVFQELATQCNYVGLLQILKGIFKDEETAKRFSCDVGDETLQQATAKIAADESAHYRFFLEISKLFLYYFPEDTLEAIKDVLDGFAMPAGDLIPNYDKFAVIVHKAGIYGTTEHEQDVVQVALNHLTIDGREALEDGIRRIRLVPDEDGEMRATAIFQTLKLEPLTQDVKKLFSRIKKYEDEIGFSDLEPTLFQPNYKVA